MFYPGKIGYNNFNIDFNRNLETQIDELNEDLVQVIYPQGYLLDIGWYPELDINGKIIIQLIKDYEWEYPKFVWEVYDEEKLIEVIEFVARFIKKYDFHTRVFLKQQRFLMIIQFLMKWMTKIF